MPCTRATRSKKNFVEEIDIENHENNISKKETTRSKGRQSTRLKNITNEVVSNSSAKNTQRANNSKSKMRTLSKTEVNAAINESGDDSISPPPTTEQLAVTLPKRRSSEYDVEEAKKKLKQNVTAEPMETDPIEAQDVREQSEMCAIDENAKAEECMELSDAKSPVTDDSATPTSLNAESPAMDTPSTSKSQQQTPPSAQTTPQAKHTRSVLPEQLLSVLSSLYLNAAERLRLNFPPRCAEDLAFCHHHHYRAILPEAPSHTHALNLRCALQQQRYVSFLNFATDMCHRGEFPGDGIFTKLIELLLSINSKTFNNDSLRQTYNKSIDLFSLIVHTFPPCWLAMRPFYINFLQCPLDLSLKNHALSKSTKIFDILLDLLEHTLEQCSPDELHDIAAAKTPTKEQQQPTAGDNCLISPPNSGNLSVCSEFYNQWEWEANESRLQSFEALTNRCRLERIFVVLRLILQILENDFVMWILHHHKKTKEWIFCTENRPLVVMLFELSLYTRLTAVVRRIFTLFANAVNKSLSRARLQIFERYIALLMVASNIADMENTVIGVKYPYLGVQTKNLIRDFFKIFKVHNTSNISNYINTIELLRVPYMRYEFIDQFLQPFYFAQTKEMMSPKKIAYDFAKKRWLQYKPQAQIDPNASDEDLSREQYLKLLLWALQSYCDWHGSKSFLHLITNNTSIRKFRTTTDSKHRQPIQGGSGGLVLQKIANDIVELEQKLKLTVRMSKPKVDLPLADICIDEEIINKYRNDLKFVMILHDNLLPKQVQSNADVDFSEWQQFLDDFAPK